MRAKHPHLLDFLDPADLSLADPLDVLDATTAGGSLPSKHHPAPGGAEAAPMSAHASVPFAANSPMRAQTASRSRQGTRAPVCCWGRKGFGRRQGAPVG